MLADNVTVVHFNGRSRKSIADPLWQYDYGQILKIEDVELPLIYEVHFSNNPHSNAKVVTGTPDGAHIPDEYLLSGASVFAWFFLHAGQDDGATEYQVEIPVRRRAKATADEPTPVEQSTISQIIADIEATADQTTAAKEAAIEAAGNAYESANDAAASATLAESYAKGGTDTRGGEDTDNAKYYYELSQGSEQAAQTAQGLAEDARDAAQGYAGQAEHVLEVIGEIVDTYVHTQSVAADEWTIVHNRNKYPSVTIVDSAGSVVVGDVQYVDRNTVVLRFSGEFSGKAYLN